MATKRHPLIRNSVDGIGVDEDNDEHCVAPEGVYVSEESVPCDPALRENLNVLFPYPEGTSSMECPVSRQEILEYLDMETVVPCEDEPASLTFVRNGALASAMCWLWSTGIVMEKSTM